MPEIVPQTPCCHKPGRGLDARGSEDEADELAIFFQASPWLAADCFKICRAASVGANAVLGGTGRRRLASGISTPSRHPPLARHESKRKRPVMNRWTEAFRGSQAADALAMPVHWYYDRAALRADYGLVDHFMVPKNPHPGSIL